MKAISYILQQYATERSYPKVDVGQIWKQYLKQLKNYAHIWKLKHCANADADANRRRRQRLGDNTWQVFLLEKKKCPKNHAQLIIQPDVLWLLLSALLH